MIVKVDPPDFDRANVVLIDSDAPENEQAVEEIEDWAADHGFARSKERWLRIIIREDRRQVYRGTCYRVTEEERASAERLVDRAAERGRRLTAE
jgi:hypothetical protein